MPHDQRGMSPAIDADAGHLTRLLVAFESIQLLAAKGPLADAVVARNHGKIADRFGDLGRLQG